MSDLRTVLERAATRVHPKVDAFERLERRRHRKTRNRRISAGVVAILVAIAGSYAAFTAFRGANGTIPGASSELHALWPEVRVSDAQAAQDAADSGDPSVSWRVDPTTVASMFATRVLGWSDALVSPVEGQAELDGPGPIHMLVSTPPVSCPSPVDGSPLPSSCFERGATLGLERLIRPDRKGIWSVVEVNSDVVDLGVQPGQQLTAGNDLHVTAPFGDQTLAIAGYHFFGEGSCNVSGFDTSGNIQSGDVTLSMPDALPADCGEAAGGYVFAYSASSADAATVDPFRSRREVPIQALSAVPVELVSSGVSASSGPLPSLAEISCSGPGNPAVLTPVIRPQADGVHLDVTNETSSDLAIDIHPVDEFDLSANSTREIVWPLAPGGYGLLCVDPTRNETPSNPQDYVDLDVQDPQGLWVPPTLGCSNSVEQYSDYTAESTGDRGSPVDIVRQRVTGLEPSDLVEPAGYAETTTEPQVRIVRDGTAIALYHFVSDGHGGWLVDRSERCSDVQLGWSDQDSARSTAYPRGWFEWCPDVSATLPFGNQSEQEAADVALRFARAYLNGDAAVVADQEDPSVPANATWTIVGDAAAISVGASAQGDPGNLVRFGCGPDVAARTWVVTVDDGTNSASADFYLFLVLRSDGWKVWASY